MEKTKGKKPEALTPLTKHSRTNPPRHRQPLTVDKVHIILFSHSQICILCRCVKSIAKLYTISFTHSLVYSGAPSFTFSLICFVCVLFIIFVRSIPRRSSFWWYLPLFRIQNYAGNLLYESIYTKYKYTHATFSFAIRIIYCFLLLHLFYPSFFI